MEKGSQLKSDGLDLKGLIGTIDKPEKDKNICNTVGPWTPFRPPVPGNLYQLSHHPPVSSTLATTCEDKG